MKKRHVFGIAAATGSLALLAACGSGTGSSERGNAATAAPDLKTEAGIKSLLDAADADARSAGFVPDPSEPDMIRALGIDGDIDEIATFEIGARYRLIGRCGTGCEEIGLIASGSNPAGSGQLIHASSDEGAGTAVQIDFTPTTAPGRLTLTLYKCTAQPCLAGYRLYKAAAPAAPAAPTAPANAN